jgi:catechol 2,3-dioxygenase-like lactoylglutathione lyase family enzyme
VSDLPRFDHVGITVSDLDAAVAFFASLGLEPGERMQVEGAFIDTVTGIDGARTEIVMMGVPGGTTTIELSCFTAPEAVAGNEPAPANVLGLRSVALEVADLRATVDRLAADGHELVGGIGQHEDVWLMTYVRGPDAITVALAERLG